MKAIVVIRTNDMRTNPEADPANGLNISARLRGTLAHALAQIHHVIIVTQTMTTGAEIAAERAAGNAQGTKQ